MFDYLVVGSGLYGAVFAHEANAHGKSVLVVDKRPNIAGNIYTENIEGINVHKYGAHIFHGKNMLQIKRGGCEDYISAESLVECIHGLPVKNIEFFTAENQRKEA